MAGGTARRAASRALLLAGYPLAGWGTSRLSKAWRSGDTRPIRAFEAGTAAVSVGLLLRRKRFLAFLNGATAAAVGVAWMSRRRRHR